MSKLLSGTHKVQVSDSDLMTDEELIRTLREEIEQQRRHFKTEVRLAHEYEALYRKEIAELKERNKKLEADRDRFRSKYGRALSLANDIAHL